MPRHSAALLRHGASHYSAPQRTTAQRTTAHHSAPQHRAPQRTTAHHSTAYGLQPIAYSLQPTAYYNKLPRGRRMHAG